MADPFDGLNADEIAALKDQLANPGRYFGQRASGDFDALNKPLAEDLVNQASLPGKSAADSANILNQIPEAPPTPTNYDKIFGKQIAQDVVDQASKPSNVSSAEQSAEILAPKELPVVSGPSSRISEALRKLGAASEGDTGDGVITLGKNEYSNLPALIEKNLPAVIGDGAEGVAAGAAKAGLSTAIGPLALLAGLYGDLANGSESKDTSVPGRPGYSFHGQDIVKDPVLPNGGMNDDQLAKYIKSNPGPVATTGNNPNADTTSSGDEDEGDSSPKLTLLPGESAPISDKPPSLLQANPELTRMKDLLERASGRNPAASSNLSMSDILSKINDNSELDKAIAQGNQMRLVSALGKGANQIGAALSNTKANQEVYDDVDKNANNPVQAVQAKQAAIGNKLAQAESTQKLQDTIQNNDPNSDINQLRKKVFTLQGKKLFGPSFSIPDNASGASLEQIGKEIDNASNKQLQRENNQALRGLAQSTKANDKQNQVSHQVEQMISSSRQTPDVIQAYKDRYAAEKGTMLLNQFPNKDAIPQSMVDTFMQEVDKVASGGVPTEGALGRVTPNGWAQKLSKAWSNLTNEPQPANAGKYLDLYQNYLQEMAGHAKDVIKNSIGKHIELNKTGMGDAQYKAFQDNYIKPFDAPITQEKATDSMHLNSALDPAIKAFMKANNITDQDEAIKILKANGRL